MQPSYKKYGIRKNPNEVLPVYNNEERFHANAESGGAQFRSLSNRSSSISPIRADGPNTAEPMDIGPVFTAITEESKEHFSNQKQKKYKIKKPKEVTKAADKDKRKSKISKRIISKKVIQKESKK